MTLKERQEAGEKVEASVRRFLMDYTPARELKVCDVHQIASHARHAAFEAFTPKNED